MTGLTNGTAYTFELRAANDSGESPAVSATATPNLVAPEAPGNFTATAGVTRGLAELDRADEHQRDRPLRHPLPGWLGRIRPMD